MYPGRHGIEKPDQPCFIMAASGEVVTYGEYEARTNRLAHLLRSVGLEQHGHYAVFMENNARYLETCGAGSRAGLYYTCINSYLNAEEVAFIVNDSHAEVLITSRSRSAVALEALPLCPKVKLALIVDKPGGEGPLVDYVEALGHFPDTPIADERLGTSMLYSSGTTGRPKGILRPLPDNPPDQPLALYEFLTELWQYREEMVYLCTFRRPSG